MLSCRYPTFPFPIVALSRTTMTDIETTDAKDASQSVGASVGGQIDRPKGRTKKEEWPVWEQLPFCRILMVMAAFLAARFEAPKH